MGWLGVFAGFFVLACAILWIFDELMRRNGRNV